MLPLRKVLLPVDFSGRCQGAARYLHALAGRFNLEVTLLHVVPPPHYEFSSVEVGGAVLDELFATRTEQMREELKTYLAGELSAIPTERVLLEGDPSRNIVTYAHDHDINLVMMPTHGYGPFRRFVLGSVTAKVLHDADCPIWTGVHLDEAPSFDHIAFKTVIVALDLGPQSCKTLQWASTFAAEYDARLLVVHATPSLEGHAGEYFDPDWKSHLAASARDAIAKIKCDVPLEGDVIIDSGDPPKVVCEIAAREKADLLVIGRGTAAGVFGRLRQNAYSIIRQSPCPVVSV